jgi:hypothetical protein
VCPSFVITAVDKDCATIKPIVISGSALLIPVTVAPETKVPDIVSKLTITSIIVVLPSWNFNMVSTIAVASFIVVDEGSFEQPVIDAPASDISHPGTNIPIEYCLINKHISTYQIVPDMLHPGNP